MMQVRSHIAAFALSLAVSTPAVATLDDDTQTPSTYTATCETVEICRESSGCAAFPTFGTLILQVQGDSGSLGHEADDPRPLDVYQALDTTRPDPSDLGLRFIVEQPANDALTRRFAYVDQTRAGPAGRYFMLECTERAE